MRSDGLRVVFQAGVYWALLMKSLRVHCERERERERVYACMFVMEKTRVCVCERANGASISEIRNHQSRRTSQLRAHLHL